MTATHARAMIGEMNREYAPSGAQNPSPAHVVPPSRTSTTAATPAERSGLRGTDCEGQTLAMWPGRSGCGSNAA
jgi:hypothetical protein